MLIDRKRAAELGRETVDILEQGNYQTGSGTGVDISQLIENAIRNTQSYPPDRSVPALTPGIRETRVYVSNDTTLAAARKLAGAGQRPTALNFASANNPGGGFLSGARAQEESLCRSSALYACLNGNPMYAFHREQRNPVYTDYAIYSPDVPVFRSDDGALLDQPYLCAFITCAAVNAKVVLERDPSRRGEIRDVMKRRIARVLEVAALHDSQALILGAWGCGAFGNESPVIAKLFREALLGDAQGVFEQIVFAITDWSDDSRFIGPFQRQLTKVK